MRAVRSDALILHARRRPPCADRPWAGAAEAPQGPGEPAPRRCRPLRRLPRNRLTRAQTRTPSAAAATRSGIATTG